MRCFIQHTYIHHIDRISESLRIKFQIHHIRIQYCKHDCPQIFSTISVSSELPPRPLSLQGACEPALRRSVAGRFLKIQSQLPAEPGRSKLQPKEKTAVGSWQFTKRNPTYKNHRGRWLAATKTRMKFQKKTVHVFISEKKHPEGPRVVL